MKQRSRDRGLAPLFTTATLFVFAPVTNTFHSTALMTLPDEPDYKPKKVATAATVTTINFNSI